MGIFCEINLVKPVNGCYRPGSTVSGTIRYTLDKDEIFDKITISLKGNGRLRMRTRHRKNNTTYRNNEEYVDMDYVIHSNEKKAPIPRGSYETQFSFTLPPNIPSSLKYFSTTRPRYVINCNILYYLRIKFEKPDFFQFNTKFRKVIRVVSGITPKLPTVPTVCGEQKTLTSLSQMFSSKKSIIKIQANIQNSVLLSCDKIGINYEVSNNTNIVIQGVETKMIEIYSFTSKGGREVHVKEDVPCTDTKTGSIKCSDVQKMDVTVNIPVDRNSLEHSNMVSRQYTVVIEAILPLPHRNAVLKIPVQIDGTGMITLNIEDPPPSYWEAIGEETKGKSHDESDDDEVGCYHSEDEKK